MSRQDPKIATAIFRRAGGGWSVAWATRRATGVLDPEPVESAPLGAQIDALLARCVDEGITFRGAVVLGLPTAWCLPGVISTQGLLRRSRHAAMVFRLEEQLPLPAESFTATFPPPEVPEATPPPEVPPEAPPEPPPEPPPPEVAPEDSVPKDPSTGATNDPAQGPWTLGIAVENDRVRSILDALIDRGVSIAAVCPTAFLAVQAMEAQDDPPLAELDLLLLRLDDRVDCVGLTRGRITAWHTALPEPEPLVRQLKLLAHAHGRPLRTTTVGLDDTLTAAAAQHTEAAPTFDNDTTTLGLAGRAAVAIVLRGDAPILDLAHGALSTGGWVQPVRRSLTAVAVAAAILLATVTGVSLWRAQQYDRLIQDTLAAQDARFEAALPGQPVPAAPLARLHSEVQRLRGTTGSSGVVPEQPDTPRDLIETLRSLPEDLRFRLLEVRLERGRLYLDGQARSHGDAETIAAALGRGSGFDVQPPRTERLTDRGVAFTLTGTETVAAADAPISTARRTSSGASSDARGGER